MVKFITIMNLFNILEFLFHQRTFDCLLCSPKLILQTYISIFKSIRGSDILQTFLDVNETTLGKMYFSSQTKTQNKAICQLSFQEIKTIPYVSSFWTSLIGEICCEKIWLSKMYLLWTG